MTLFQWQISLFSCLSFSNPDLKIKPLRVFRTAGKGIDIMSEKWKVHFCNLWRRWSLQTCHLITNPNQCWGGLLLQHNLCRRRIPLIALSMPGNPDTEPDRDFHGNQLPLSPPKPVRPPDLILNALTPDSPAGKDELKQQLRNKSDFWIWYKTSRNFSKDFFLWISMTICIFSFEKLAPSRSVLWATWVEKCFKC